VTAYVLTVDLAGDKYPVPIPPPVEALQDVAGLRFNHEDDEVWRVPRLASWERFSRPYGTRLAPNLYPALRAGLSSAVPAGLITIRFEGRSDPAGLFALWGKLHGSAVCRR
jgi:hypothetical protein